MADQWNDIKTAPRYKPVWVMLECGFQCAAEHKSRSCYDMCVPRGQKIHTLHVHDEWVMVDDDGDEVHPLWGRKTINPTAWRYMKGMDSDPS